MGLLIALICLAPASAAAQSPQDAQPDGLIYHPGRRPPDKLLDPDRSTLRGDDPQALSARQKQNIMRAHFELSKSDAAELAALAKRLREELDKPNANILSLEVMSRAEKIEKLAKKIREETKMF
jgi:hypothetical protein